MEENLRKHVKVHHHSIPRIKYNSSSTTNTWRKLQPNSKTNKRTINSSLIISNLKTKNSKIRIKLFPPPATTPKMKRLTRSTPSTTKLSQIPSPRLKIDSHSTIQENFMLEILTIRKILVPNNYTTKDKVQPQPYKSSMKIRYKNLRKNLNLKAIINPYKRINLRNLSRTKNPGRIHLKKVRKATPTSPVGGAVKYDYIGYVFKIHSLFVLTFLLFSSPLRAFSV